MRFREKVVAASLGGIVWGCARLAGAGEAGLPDSVPREPAKGVDSPKPRSGQVKLPPPGRPGDGDGAGDEKEESPLRPVDAGPSTGRSASKKVFLPSPRETFAAQGIPEPVPRSLQRKNAVEQQRARVQDLLRQERERRVKTPDRSEQQRERARKELELRRLTEEQRRRAVEARKDYLENLPDRSAQWRARQQQTFWQNRRLLEERIRMANQLDRTEVRREQVRLQEERRRQLVRDEWRRANDRTDNPAEMPWNREPRW